MFEATRPHWHADAGCGSGSAAKNVSFVRDRFVDLGRQGSGSATTPARNQTGVGLGANGVNVTGCVFNQIAGGGIVVGGIQAKAHHP